VSLPDSSEPFAWLVKADPDSLFYRATVYAGPAPRVIPEVTSDDLPKRRERLEGLNLGPHLPSPHSGNVRERSKP